MDIDSILSAVSSELAEPRQLQRALWLNITVGGETLCGRGKARPVETVPQEWVDIGPENPTEEYIRAYIGNADDTMARLEAGEVIHHYHLFRFKPREA